MSEKFFVVARPGYQVLLNIGPDCLTIDEFHAVDLNDLYSAETLENCGSLKQHLREGNLIPYTGEQVLPEDPNEKKVAALRNASAQHLDVKFEQKPVESDHPTMHFETNAEKVPVVNGQTLQDRVVANRQKMEEDDNKLRARLAMQSEIDAQENTMDPREMDVKEMTKEQLNLKVAMDVNPETFKKKQQEQRAALDIKTRLEEDTAQAEIDSLESGD